MWSLSVASEALSGFQFKLREEIETKSDYKKMVNLL